jgi:SPP1 gp7 family putative phage head morphogenesis protein
MKDTERILKELYSGKTPGNDLLNLTGKTLADKVGESYKDIAVDFTTPDAEMLTRLTRDVWQFSAAKDYQQLRDLTLALKDENGNLRTFDDFKEAAGKVCEKYNETWMRSEYTFSVAASQNAARWTKFEKEADVIPFLRYHTVGDNNVRPEHAVLDGVVRHIKDAFWSTHYPPNGWGCRCEAVQELDGEQTETPAEKAPTIGISPIFRTNLAQTGLIFPKNHPYYRGIPKAELRKSIAYLPPQNTYLDVIIGNHKIEIHPLHGDKELFKNINACNTLMMLDEKAKIKLLPIIEEKDAAAKKLFFPKTYLKKFPRKNPDILYNGKVAEIEVANGSKASIQNAIKNGKKQSDFILVSAPNNVDLAGFDQIIKGQLKHYENKENLTIWLFNDTGVVKYATKQKR